MTDDAKVHVVPPTAGPAPSSLPQFALLPLLAIATGLTALLVAYANNEGLEHGPDVRPPDRARSRQQVLSWLLASCVLCWPGARCSIKATGRRLSLVTSQGVRPAAGRGQPCVL